MPTLKQRDEWRKMLVQHYVKLITAGATKNRARQLTAAKARSVSPDCAKLVSTVLAYLEGEDEDA